MFWIYSSNPPPLVLLFVQGQIFFPIYSFLTLLIPSHPSLVLYKYPSIQYPLNLLHIEHGPPISFPYSLHKPSHSSLILYTYPPSLPIFDSTHIFPFFPSLHIPFYSISLKISAHPSHPSPILYTYTLPSFHYSLNMPSHSSHVLYTHPSIFPLFSTHIPQPFPYSLHIFLPSFLYSRHIPSHPSHSKYAYIYCKLWRLVE